ncbi:Hypothetical predicted protein [Paramuricea clavata]|uniref:Uncharacterized protein n=1 Tax=Paramuricea clavata TaxID=317549 RepID=A0A6S7GEI7_PARCT|nr:Hypothetical predicted protein [Paramuricea clavata]
MAAINKRQAVLVILLILRRRQRRKGANNREIWTRSWIQRRRELGFYRTFLCEIKDGDIETFKRFTRMTPENFQKLVTILSPYITKQDTNMRESISAEERFLASGESFRSLSFAFRVGERTISEIVKETCQVIYHVMKDTFLKVRKIRY